MNDKKKKNEAQDKIMNASQLVGRGVKPPVYDIIGRKLREYYDEVAREPVPDRFLELLNRLESTTPKKDR